MRLETKWPGQSERMIRVGLMVVLWLGTALVASALEPQAPVLDWGALGPFFRHARTEDGMQSETALLRPLYGRFVDRNRDRVWQDFLWPVAVTRADGSSRHERVLLFLHTDPDVADPEGAERWWLLPLLFRGRDADGVPYFALFPAHGTIRDIVGFDEIRFTCFPAYLRTRRGHLESTSYLWPVFSRTTGPDLWKWRVFPFYAASRNRQEVRQSILWPLFSRVERLSGHAGSSGFLCFPLGGRLRHYDADGRQVGASWSLLWPLFSGHRSPGEERLNCPWPFIRHWRRETEQGTTRGRAYWPLYQRVERPGEEQTSWLWPFFHKRTRLAPESGGESGTWFYALPFYWQVKRENGPELERETVRQLWPLFRYESRDGTSRLQTLALWPMRHAAPIDRNYAPLWTLFERRTEEQGAVGRDRLLWGLWERHWDGDGTVHRSRLWPLFDLRFGSGETRLHIGPWWPWGRAKGERASEHGPSPADE
jgi:hypothetical protein